MLTSWARRTPASSASDPGRFSRRTTNWVDTASPQGRGNRGRPEKPAHPRSDPQPAWARLLDAAAAAAPQAGAPQPPQRGDEGGAAVGTDSTDFDHTATRGARQELTFLRDGKGSRQSDGKEAGPPTGWGKAQARTPLGTATCAANGCSSTPLSSMPPRPHAARRGQRTPLQVGTRPAPHRVQVSRTLMEKAPEGGGITVAGQPSRVLPAPGIVPDECRKRRGAGRRGGGAARALGAGRRPGVQNPAPSRGMPPSARS